MELSFQSVAIAAQASADGSAPSAPLAAAQPVSIPPLDSESLFRCAFDQATIALVVLDLNGRFVRVNQTMCELVGVEQVELLSRDFSSIAGGEDVQVAVDALGRFQNGQCRWACLERRYRHESGRDIHVVENVSLVCDPAGGPGYLLAHVQDVTEQRRTAMLETDRRQVLEMVAQDQPLPSTLHQLVRLLERQMPGAWACVMLLQDGTIRPFAPSLPPTFADAIASRPVSFAARLAAGPIGQATTPRIAPVDTDPAWKGLRTEARQAGVQCCWAVTVAGGDSVPLGLLVIFSGEDRGPGPTERAVIDIASRLATIAVEHHLTTRQLAHLVRHDALTGLPNRILFEDRLHHSLATSRRNGRPLALLAIDLNRFKQVNDTLGHQAGDSLLRQFALRVRKCLRESDTFARVGGDEFMLILSDLNGPEDAEVVSRRIRGALAAEPFDVAGRAVTGSCSIGIAVYPADGDDALLLQRAADDAMYREKENSRREEANSAA